MEQKFNLTISKPCSEEFNTFKTTRSGGFCNSCRKEVVDFRSMSDEKLIQFLKDREGNTCGYFKTSQLKDYSYVKEVHKTNKFKYLKIISLTFISLVSLQNILAQDKKIKTEIIDNANGIKNGTHKNPYQERLLKGIITDETGPLPGANIMLKGTNIGATTNFDGEFEFPKPLKEGDVLVVSFLGYKTKEVIIMNNQLSLSTQVDFNIKMNEELIFTMGEVAVDEVYTSKRSFWRKIKDIF